MKEEWEESKAKNGLKCLPFYQARVVVEHIHGNYFNLYWGLTAAEPEDVEKICKRSRQILRANRQFTREEKTKSIRLSIIGCAKQK